MEHRKVSGICGKDNKAGSCLHYIELQLPRRIWNSEFKTGDRDLGLIYTEKAIEIMKLDEFTERETIGQET